MKKFLIVFFALLIVCTLIFAQGKQEEGTSEAGDIRIGLSIIGTEHNWDINAYNGAKDRAKELGCKVLAFDGERRPDKQLSDVKTLINDKVDVIAVILGDTQSLVPVLKEAKEAGIPVVTADFANEYTLCNVGTNNAVAMAALVEKMCEDLNGEGEVAIFYTPGAPVAEARKAAFDSVLIKYPNVKVVATETYVVPGTVPDAYDKTKDLLRANPEIDAFWTVFDMPMIGSATAIADMGLNNTVKCYGFDGDPTAMAMLQDPNSAYAATVAQQPYLIGQTVIDQAIKAAKGEALEKTVDVDFILVDSSNVDEVLNALPGYKK